MVGALNIRQVGAVCCRSELLSASYCVYRVQRELLMTGAFGLPVLAALPDNPPNAYRKVCAGNDYRYDSLLNNAFAH